MGQHRIVLLLALLLILAPLVFASSLLETSYPLLQNTSPTADHVFAYTSDGNIALLYTNGTIGWESAIPIVTDTIITGSYEGGAFVHQESVPRTMFYFSPTGQRTAITPPNVGQGPYRIYQDPFSKTVHGSQIGTSFNEYFIISPTTYVQLYASGSFSVPSNDPTSFISRDEGGVFINSIHGSAVSMASSVGGRLGLPKNSLRSFSTAFSIAASVDIVSAERMPTISVATPNRYYHMTVSSGEITAKNFSNSELWTGSVLGGAQTGYAVYSPGTSGPEVNRMVTMSKRNNELVVVSTITNATTGHRYLHGQIYNRNGVGQLTFFEGAFNYPTNYTVQGIATDDTGNVIILYDKQTAASTEKWLLIIDRQDLGRSNVQVDDDISRIGGNTIDEYTFFYMSGSNIRYFSRFHDFDAAPLDAYDYLETGSAPSYVTYDFIDLDNKYVELTLTDVTLDNFEIPFLVYDGIASGTQRYAAINYDPVELTNSSYNSTLLTAESYDIQINASAASNTSATFIEHKFQLYPTFTGTGVDLMDIQIDISGSTISFAYDLEIWLKSQSFNGYVTDYQHGVRLVDSKSFTDYNALANPYSHIVGEDTPTTTSTNIDRIDFVIIEDRTNSRILMRADIVRPDEEDTVIASGWREFASLGTIESINLSGTLSGDETLQFGYTMNTMTRPVFSTPLVDGEIHDQTRRLTFQLLQGGENTLRVYHTRDQVDSPFNYDEWTYKVNLNNAIIIGVPTTPLTPTPDVVTPGVSDGESFFGLPLFDSYGLTTQQSTTVYTFLLIVLTWVLMWLIGSQVGEPGVTSILMYIAFILSIFIFIAASLFGWIPIIFLILMVIGAAIYGTLFFRRTFIGSGGV